MRGIRRAAFAAGVALVTLASPAAAQYTAPPPDPGFQYIFDGTATGSNASFDKWTYAGSTAANSATAGRATLDAAAGAIRVSTSPFGSYWYTPKQFGDVVFRIRYQIEDTPTATPNGGVMVRAPEFRYTGADTNAVLAQKPTGFNFEACGGALPICNKTTPGASTVVQLGRRARPVPARGRVHRRLLRAPDRGRRLQRQRRQRPAADDQRQRQQQPALDAGLLRPRDPDQRVADRRRAAPVRRRDQDRLGLRLPQPQRPAVAHLRAPRRGRVAHDGGPHDRPAVHDHGRRQHHQPVRQLDPEDQHPRRRPADDGAPVRAGLPRPADPRRQRPHLLQGDPGQGGRAGRRPGQHGRPVGHRLGLPGQRADAATTARGTPRPAASASSSGTARTSSLRRTRASARRAPPTWATSPPRPTRATARRR